MNFKYLVYPVFFIKCFFSTQDCAFPISKGLVNFGRRGLGVMFTNVTSWSLRLFLNIPFLLKSSLFSKMLVNLTQYRETVGTFNNRHSARELKYRNLFLRSHYHNNIFAHCFFLRNWFLICITSNSVPGNKT